MRPLIINEYTKAEFALWNSFFGNGAETKKTIADAFSIPRGEQALDLSGSALAVCGEIGQAQTIAGGIAARESRDVTAISLSTVKREWRRPG